ncbi:adenosylcobinamide-GDP ribazoletransferase [Gorillibacterium massiliense]|uniref:adenosylcobinamide-GDP ribazoletransferase n=1 Tax=Gorillibacterium massiliense TaxID=1280390 RepID=UPI0004B89D22|nr:adenosylcobinamide-GDP ribazoletransferase [Gorillibacterium massiliense]
MSVLKAFVIAFSMYSKIPMPQFEWKDRDMKYALCFFPWVGAVIGLLTYGWGMLYQHYEVGPLFFAAVGTAIPILVSGGLHVDGYMDSMDAFHSYQSREKKLEILKDPHIGAFSVIRVIVYYLLYVGAYSELGNLKAVALVGAGFFLSRTLCGIGVVSLHGAKKEGLLYMFSSIAHEKAVKIALYAQLAGCAAVLLYLSLWVGIAALAGALLTFCYYRYRCYKELGGITGDTSGYFVTLCEGATVIIVAVCCIGKFI